MKRRWAGLTAVAAAFLMVGASPTAASRSASADEVLPSGATARVSVSSTDAQANGDSDSLDLVSQPTLSWNGRFVAFASRASNLVPGDVNGTFDVFVRDRRTGTTRLLSIGRNRAPANGMSYGPAISADGRFVAFVSEASNLVPGDTNDATDIFVRDRWTGTTRRVSVGRNGAQGNSTSITPAISANGRFVVFWSDSTNLVQADTNGFGDIFVRDRNIGATRRVSVGAHGIQANGQSLPWPAISADGRFVAFLTSATNLLSPVHVNGWNDVYLRDRWTGRLSRITVPLASGDSNNFIPPRMSANGRFVVFETDASTVVPGDTNGAVDVFVRDRWTGQTDRVSVNTSGIGANDNSSFFDAVISADGRFVAFESFATNLVPGDTNGWSDVFLRDRRAATTRRVSVSTLGTQANGSSFEPGISADGRFVVFSSDATNLLGFHQDTNNAWDVFIHRR